MECDVCAIRNLIYRYAEHMDRGELDRVGALFGDLSRHLLRPV